MKAEHEHYIDSFALTAPLRQRVEVVLMEFAAMCPEEIEGIFISEYVQQDSTRVYEGLWAFSARYLMEAKNFVSQDDYDILQTSISYVRINKEAYKLGEQATELSRLTVSFTSESGGFGISGTLKASGRNCDSLVAMWRRFFIPSLENR